MKMSGTPEISDRILTAFSLLGLLLGLLVNAVVTIRFDEYNADVVDLIKISFLFSTGFLVIAIMKGLTAHLSASVPNSIVDPEIILKSTYNWLISSLIFMTGAVALIITNSINLTLSFMAVLAFFFLYEMYKLMKKRYWSTKGQK